MTNAAKDGKTDVEQGVLDEIVRRIVEVADPERILLFGSTARQSAGPNSDLDLLVVKRGHFHRGHLTGRIYQRLIGVGRAVDIVVTPADIDRYRDSPALVIGPALRDGRLVYVAGATHTHHPTLPAPTRAPCPNTARSGRSRTGDADCPTMKVNAPSF